MNPPIKYRQQGPLVAKWQAFLEANDYDLGPWGIDHDFGVATEQATERFQARNNLPVTGIVGVAEWDLAWRANYSKITSSKPAVKVDDVEASTDEEIDALIGPEGYQLILDYEVGGGQSYYDKKLKAPCWPGAYSGITIGVGWDLKFNSPVQFDRAWGPLISDQSVTVPQYRRLIAFCERDGSKSAASTLKDIQIPWDHAERVFCDETIPRYWALTCNTFPGVEKLPIQVRAGLLSLVFNRGGSLKGPKRRRMRLIRELVPRRDIRGIAAATKDMIELWQGMDVYLGLKRRRFAEADHMLKALASA